MTTRENNPNWRGGKDFKCPICEKLFWVKPSAFKRRKTCSKKCLILLWKQTGKYKGENNPAYGSPKIELTCKNCGKKFERLVRIQRKSKCKEVYCSKICIAKTIGKRSKVGSLNPNYGKGEGIKGRLNPNWRGGIAFFPYTPEFNYTLKEKIRNKFNRKCAECEFSEDRLGYKLHIHHIDYDKENNREDNLIPLCRNCHQQTNFKRTDWTKYFQDKLAVA